MHPVSTVGGLKLPKEAKAGSAFLSEPRFNACSQTAVADQVYFGKAAAVATDKKLRILPPEFPMIIVPGMFGPKSSVNNTRIYFKTQGQDVVKAVKVPANQFAQSVKGASRWLNDLVDDVRIQVARKKIDEIEEKLARANTPQERQQRLREIFSLDDTPEGRQIVDVLDAYLVTVFDAVKTLPTPYLLQGPKTFRELAEGITEDVEAMDRHVMSKVRKTDAGPKKELFQALGDIGAKLHNYYVNAAWSRFTGFEVSDPLTFVLHLFKAKPRRDRLSSHLGIFRKKLLRKLPEHYSREQKVKIANKIVDTFAPRAILVGHSMGGFTSLETAQNGKHRPAADSTQPDYSDIGMVIGMGSPLNGVEKPPPNFEFLLKHATMETLERYLLPVLGFVLPATTQMMKGSAEVEGMQARPLPYDTSGASIAAPKDGLVMPENAMLPEEQDNTLNLVVSPKDTSLNKLVSPYLQMVLTSPPVQWVMSWVPLPKAPKGIEQHVDGLRYHCVHVDHHEAHWSGKGELTEQIFETVGDTEKLKRLLHPSNFEPLRENTMRVLMARIKKSPEKREKYQDLIPLIEEIAASPLPFGNSADKVAKELLKALQKSDPVLTA